MSKIVSVSVVTAFATLGWWLGSSFGIMTAFALSMLGSVVGVVIAWKIKQMAGG